MRPIFATKISNAVQTYLITPYGASSFIDWAQNHGTSFFNLLTAGGHTAVQFGSKVYTRFYPSLYEYDTISLNNTAFRTPSDVNYSTGTREWYQGVYIANVSGTWFLVQMYPTTASAVKADRYNFSTQTWSVALSLHSFGDSNFPSFRYQFGNSIYWFLGDSNNTSITTYKYDIGAHTVSSFASPASCDYLTISLSSYRGNIYALGHNSTSLKLFQLVGGVWQNIKTINTPGGLTNSKTQMFTDGTYLYCIAYYATSGWRMWQLDSGLNATEISSNVFPSYLLVNAGLNNGAGFKGVHIDSHLDPANPEIWLTYTSAQYTIGAGLSWFKWLGPSSQIQYAGDAGEGGPDYLIGYSSDGGGQNIFSPGEPNIQIEGALSSAATAGNVDVPFRVYESNNVPSGALVDVNLYFSTNPHPPRSQGRITAPTPSGIQVDDYTIRVPSGSGQLWGLEWRSAADGVQVGEQVSVTLYTSKAGV